MTSKSRKREVARSPEDKARKRDLILDATMKLVMERGYTKTTMTDVAREAGIGRGTVYWHFESKEDLAYALMHREIAKIEQGYGPVLEAPGSAMEKIEMFAMVSMHALHEAGAFFKPMVSIVAGGSPDLEMRLLALWKDMYARYNGIVEDLLEQGKREGDVRSDLDSHVAAAAIVGMIDAMYLQVMFELVDHDPERVGSACLSLVRDGWIPRDGGAS